MKLKRTGLCPQQTNMRVLVSELRNIDSFSRDIFILGTLEIRETRAKDGGKQVQHRDALRRPVDFYEIIQIDPNRVRFNDGYVLASPICTTKRRRLERDTLFQRLREDSKQSAQLQTLHDDLNCIEGLVLHCLRAAVRGRDSTFL